jgi:hypothetical protein
MIDRISIGMVFVSFVLDYLNHANQTISSFLSILPRGIREPVPIVQYH